MSKREGRSGVTGKERTRDSEGNKYLSEKEGESEKCRRSFRYK